MGGEEEQADAGPGAAPPAEPAPSLAPQAADAPADEFAAFMSDVTETVTQQVESWKVRLSETIMRWEGEGYRTARLSKVLDQGASSAAEASVKEFERDVGRLQKLETEMAGLDAGAAGDAVFRNPDRVAEAEELVQQAKEGLTPPPGPSTAWAFEDFVDGESNKLALSGARAVAEQPGSLYNPLVLVGPAGVGKTHLLHGIGHALAVAPGALVACLSAQDYLDELVQAIDANRVDAWRSRYRRATAFLLDDVHLLTGKVRSQEELFNLFNLLHDSQRQMVFTLKQPPREVDGLNDRLVSRMEGGLLAVLPPPDRDLRLAIVSGQLTERLGLVDEDLVNYMADRPAESVRSLLALVQRVLRSAEAKEVPPSAALARELLEGAAEPRRRPSVGVRTSGLTSGLMTAPMGGIRSREKMVWRWPEPQERLVEELS